MLTKRYFYKMVKSVCGVCVKAVTSKSRGIECDECLVWFHLRVCVWGGASEHGPVEPPEHRLSV